MLKGVLWCLAILVLALGTLPASEAWGQEEDVFFEEKPASRSQAIALSALFPGLGQIASGHRIKGTILFVSEILAVTVAIHAHEVRATKVDQFDQMSDEYAQMQHGGNYADADAKWNDMVETRDDIDTFQGLRLGFACASAGIYLYSLIDALFFNRYEVSQGGMAPAGRGVRICVRADPGTPGVVIAKSW